MINWVRVRGRVGRGAQDFLIKMRGNRYRGGGLSRKACSVVF